MDLYIRLYLLEGIFGISNGIKMLIFFSLVYICFNTISAYLILKG